VPLPLLDAGDGLDHAERHHGIGQQLLDGQQVAIIAHATTGDHDLAAHLIAESELSTLWEHTVAATLRSTSATGSAPPASMPQQPASGSNTDSSPR
jgi:hypothetical protein